MGEARWGRSGRMSDAEGKPVEFERLVILVGVGHHTGVKSQRPRIILFDIDGTLVSTGGAGRRAMAAALSSFLGRPWRLSFNFAGMTDRAILRRAVEEGGGLYDEAAHEAICAIYLDALRSELPRSTGYRTMPGVHAFVDACRAIPGAVVGLGTGNIKAAALMKLAPGGLDGRFVFGGFGDDAEDRAEMLAVGVRRGAELLGGPVEACDVWIIGDTVRDIDAARVLGARCVAVSTGGASVEELADAGAWQAVTDLTQPGLLDEMLSA